MSHKKESKTVVIPEGVDLNLIQLAPSVENNSRGANRIGGNEDLTKQNKEIESYTFESGFEKLITDLHKDQERSFLDGSLKRNESQLADSTSASTQPEQSLEANEAKNSDADDLGNCAVGVDTEVLEEIVSRVSRDNQQSFEYPDDIYENLPPLLRKPFNEVISKKQHRDLALTVLIACLSGMLPNYYTKYDGSTLSPNLYLVVVGPFGEGKGYNKFLKRILEKTHRRKLREADEDKKRYLDEIAAIESGESSMKKSEVQRPRRIKLFVPGNITKSGLIDLANQNGGYIIIMESEIDTIVEADKAEHGKHSDFFRNGFQNEGYSFYRRTNDESIEIERLYVTIVLSGTPGQLFSLIPKIENGLFSRFAYFSMKEDHEFHDVFEEGKLQLEEYFDNYATPFDDIHQTLENRTTPVMFAFQKHQEVAFTNLFQQMKIELRENVDPAFGGVVHRLAVMCQRIAQILSVYRIAYKSSIPDKIVCEDIDFNTSITLIKILKNHTLKIYYQMPAGISNKPRSNEEVDKAELIKKAKQLYTEVKSYRKVSTSLFGKPTMHQTVYRWVNNL